MQINVCCKGALYTPHVECKEHGLSNYNINGQLGDLVKEADELRSANERLKHELSELQKKIQ